MHIVYHSSTEEKEEKTTGNLFDTSIYVRPKRWNEVSICHDYLQTKRKQRKIDVRPIMNVDVSICVSYGIKSAYPCALIDNVNSKRCFVSDIKKSCCDKIHTIDKIN